MKIRITPKTIALFEEHRFFSGPYGKARLKPGHTIDVPPDAIIEDYSNLFAGENLPLGFGAFSYSFAKLSDLYTVGRYCSIAAVCDVMGSAHPTDWASTSPFSHHPQPVSSVRAYLVDRGVQRFDIQHFERGNQNVTLGNDVWLGEAALVKRGTTIGDGAVVAARAIVTRDVPPYAIVAGSPARIVRYRFAAPVVERLLRSEWWRFGPDQLQALDVREPEQFLDRLEEAVAAGLEAPDIGHLTGAEIIAAGETLV